MHDNTGLIVSTDDIDSSSNVYNETSLSVSTNNINSDTLTLIVSLANFNSVRVSCRNNWVVSIVNMNSGDNIQAKTIGSFN